MADNVLQRLERLEIRERIRETAAAYCRILDETRSLDELAQLFSPDAVLRNPTEYTGRDTILAYYGAFFASGVGVSRHHIVNETITLLDDGRARLDAAFLVLLARDGRSFVGFGRYADTLEQHADGWRFVEKVNDVRRMVPLEEGWQ